MSLGFDYPAVKSRMEERLREAGRARRAADALSVRRALEAIERHLGAARVLLLPARRPDVDPAADESEVA